MRKFSFLVAIVVGCFLGTVASNLIINPQTAIAEPSGNPSVIKASRIELVDTNGKKRASLELEDNDKMAALNMWDSNEKLLLSLKASQDSSVLLMNKKDFSGSTSIGSPNRIIAFRSPRIPADRDFSMSSSNLSIVSAMRSIVGFDEIYSPG